MIKDWYDRITSFVAYMMSGLGMTLSGLTFEQWYFVGSLIIGVIALILNFWHKRRLQKIALKQGITIDVG